MSSSPKDPKEAFTAMPELELEGEVKSHVGGATISLSGRLTPEQLAAIRALLTKGES